MKKLSEFINPLSPEEILHFQDHPVTGIACRPEDLREGMLYAIMDEFLEYGHWNKGLELFHLARASQPCTPDSSVPEMKMSALLLESPLPDIPVPQIVVSDARKAAAQAAKFFFDAPDASLKIVGITGTNGKTTTSHLINRLLSVCGEKAAALGTLGVYFGHEKYAESVYTTPLSPTLFETLHHLKNKGVSHVAMEISSHALKLDRVFGLDVDVAVFTNLTRDHLDFHETLEDYRDSKMKLFAGLKSDAVAVVNADDPMGKEILFRLPCKAMTYGFSSEALLRAVQIRYSPRGTDFSLRYRGRQWEISTMLVGKFNVYNSLAAIAACLSLGMEPEALQKAARQALRGVEGRVEIIPLPGNRTGIVDYAHTPDSLEKILEVLRGISDSERIITVFGCGGDRDRGKRPLMGEIAARLSDICVVTSDNPRRENPSGIIEDILAGMPREGKQVAGNRGQVNNLPPFTCNLSPVTCNLSPVIVEPDRRKAIRQAFEMSQSGDIILLAGKGHEPYQIVGDEYFPFDDREELRCLK